MYGHYALPVTGPTRTICQVCGAPAQLARVHAGRTLGAWCGPDCSLGRQARDLAVGEEVTVHVAKFPEVGDWPVRHRTMGPGLASILPHGLAARVVVTAVTDAAVVLTNPGGRPYEQLRIPADFPCTHYTGITAAPPHEPQPGRLLRRWPVDGPWTREVTFGHWVSHQAQGLCEDDADCAAPATLWVSYRAGTPTADDAPSCEGCLARRLRRRATAGRRTTPPPVPVAVWDVGLEAWDVRRYDGCATRLA